MKKIAILFELDENWIGGSYYIRNLVSALGTLPDSERPHITLISTKRSSVKFIQETGYPHLSWVTNEQFDTEADAFPFDVIFPYPAAGQGARTISWIPDFQELHLSHYFTPAEISNRRHHHRLRFQTAGLVVSSEDVKTDVERFYPGECANVSVVHFATFDRLNQADISSLPAKYDLTRPFVMCANQVWLHKNHLIVLKAVSLLKAKGIQVTVCFTGSESDYRIHGYSAFLKSLAEKWGITDSVRFLGFIPRNDQLGLMKLAQYVIQPSLFEGWSTVIEDAKAMGQFVVASDLGVHKEQLAANSRFFARNNPNMLAEIMAEFAGRPPVVTQPLDYRECQLAFGRDFLGAIDKFINIDAVQGEHKLNLADLKQISTANFSFNRDIPSENGDLSVSPIQQTFANFSFYYYEVDNYSHVLITNQRSDGQKIIILQKSNNNYSIEFKIDADRYDFEQRFIEVDAYRLYFDNEAGDIGDRYSGLSAGAKQMLHDVANQDMANVYVFGEDISGNSRNILSHCLEKLQFLNANSAI